MITPAQFQKRLENDYRMMSTLPEYMTWSPIGSGRPPRKYMVTIHKRYEAVDRRFYNSISLLMELPDDYIEKGPLIRVAPGYPIPYAPNWFTIGNICKGNIWKILKGSMTLPDFLINVTRVLVHDPKVTDPTSPANITARNTYYSPTSDGKWKAKSTYVMTDSLD